MPWNRQAVRLLPVVLLTALGTSCDGFFVSNNSIQSVTISPLSVILRADASTPATFALTSTAQTVGQASSNQGGTTDTTTANWTSSNSSAVTVGNGKTDGGVITAVAGVAGGQTATITAADGGQSGTATVLTYTGTAPGSLTLNVPAGDSTPAVGATFRITASANINNNSAYPITQYVTWTSDNAAVCTVISSGLSGGFVSALTAGTCAITATAQFSDVSNPVSTQVTINVGGI